MAVTVSGLYVPTFRDALDASANNLDLTAASKIALFDNTIAPNFTTDTAYGVAPYNAGEVTGTNWASGGITITSPTLTASGGALVFDAADVSVASATFTGAVCCLIYADTLAGNEAIILVYFGGTAYSPVAGTFGITWGTSIFSLDLTP
jgi:hypothetical protein